MTGKTFFFFCTLYTLAILWEKGVYYSDLYTHIKIDARVKINIYDVCQRLIYRSTSLNSIYSTHINIIHPGEK